MEMNGVLKCDINRGSEGLNKVETLSISKRNMAVVPIGAEYFMIESNIFTSVCE